MICARCGQSFPTDAAVCPSCGLTLPTSPATTAATEQRCPVCGASTAPDSVSCPHCDTPVSSQASQPSQTIRQYPTAEGASGAGQSYVPPSPEEQTGSPTVPYARSRYGQAPNEPHPDIRSPSIPADIITRAPPTIPVLTPSEAPATSGDESESAWANVPPLLTTDGAEEVPFAITAAFTADKPDEPDKPDDDGLPDYETPDVERPAIHVPQPPLPDYDTPDVERPAVHPTPMIEPAMGQPAPAAAAYDADNVASAAVSANDTSGAPLSTAASSYPGSYSSPIAAQINGTPPLTPSAPATPATGVSPGNTQAHNVVERFFGAQPAPKAHNANTTVQRLWLRFLPPEWAVAPWISIPIGALVALVAGLLVTVLGLIFWSRAIGYLLTSSNAAGASENLVQAVLSPNLLQLFLLEHGVSMTLALGSPGATGSFSAVETLPLTGLSLIPACALILAGYIAAASDFTHLLRFSVLRGALVGPVYGVLLALVAVFGASTVPAGQNTMIQLQPSVAHAFLAGLVWGTLLGALGSLLAIRRLHLFTTNQTPDVLAGASWGALIALGSGMLLALVALAAGMAAHAVSTMPTTTTTQPGDGFAGAINAVLVGIALLIVVAPVAELWLFALGTGASIDRWLTTSGTNVESGSSSFGLLIAQHHPTSIAWWLLLLIPLASYAIGGRAAARIAGADSPRDGALVGWLMGVALSVLMLVLMLLSRVLISVDATLFRRPIATNLGIAPSAEGTFVLVLLIGGLVGALAGVSAVWAFEPGARVAAQTSSLLSRLEPVLAVARRPWDMLDAARGQRSPRTTLRVLIYTALVLAVLLGAIFALVVLIGLLASRFAPISAIRGFDGFFAGLAVGVPLLLLTSVAILALLQALPPLLTAHHTRPPILPRYSGGPSATN